MAICALASLCGVGSASAQPAPSGGAPAPSSTPTSSEAPTPSSAPAPGSAAPQSAEAWFAAGNAAYDAGRFEEAERAYREAYRQKQSFDIAGNLAQTLVKLGKMRDAAELLAITIRTFPPTGSESTRAKIQQMLDAARGHVSALRVAVDPPGATVSLDGRPVGVAPLADELFTEPGAHEISAERAGFVGARQHLTAPKGSTQNVQLALAPAPEEGPSPLVLGIGYGLGGAGIVVGAVLLGLSGGKTSDADDRLATLEATRGAQPCRTGGDECLQIQSLRAESDTLVQAGVWTFVGSGVLVAATTAYLLAELPGRSDDSEPELAVAGGWLPGGGSLIVRGTW